MTYKIWNPNAESYPAGIKCPVCGAGMEYLDGRNSTLNKKHTLLVCPICGNCCEAPY